MKRNVHFLIVLSMVFLGKINAQFDFIEHSNPSGDKCFNVTKSADGDIYVASEQGQVFVYNGVDWTTVTVPGSFSDDDVYDVAVAQDGTLWIAMKNKGVVSYNGTDFTFYDTSNSGIGEDSVNSIEISSSGTIYASSVNFLNIYKNGSWTNIDMATSDIFNNFIGEIVVDGDRVWIDNFYSIVTLENDVFKNYSVGDFEGDIAFNDQIYTLTLTADKTVLIGHNNGVAGFKDGIGSQIVTFDEGGCNAVVAASTTEFWAYTRLQHAFYAYNDGETIKYDVGSFPFVEDKDSYMVEGLNGDIWIVNLGGGIYQLLNVISQVDLDQDGYTESIDCDDNDPAINPGAYDIGNNGIDENCDGVDNIYTPGCWDDFSGIFKATATVTNQGAGIGWDSCDDALWQGTLYFEEDSQSPGSYHIFTTNPTTGVTFEDISMGAYYACYETSLAGDFPNGDLLFVPTCDGISISGTSQWGELYFIENIMTTPSQVSFNWRNDYGEGAFIVLEREDGADLIVIDDDADGFISSLDCDDTNADINPNQSEVAYNGIDDDCDPSTLDDDLDQDGFNIDTDCDDNNADINPAGEEIANNGIDEDCDGEDLILDAVVDISKTDYTIWPNPVSTTLIINNDKDVAVDKTINIYDFHGRLVKVVTNNKSNSEILVDHFDQGAYLLEIIEDKSKDLIRAMFIKI